MDKFTAKLMVSLAALALVAALPIVAATVDDDFTKSLDVTLSEEKPKKSTISPKTRLIFTILGSICALPLIGCLLHKLVKMIRGYIAHARERAMALERTARERLVDSFPLHSYDPEVDQSTACGICLDDYIVGEPLQKLPRCNHTFRVHCIRKYWSTTSSLFCPVCRRDHTTWQPDEI